MATFVRQSPMPVSAAALFDWHARDGAFDRLAPPGARIVRSEGPFASRRVTIALPPPGGRFDAQHEDVVPGQQFVDRMVGGPFAFWRHTHRFVAVSETRSELQDHIEWRLPLAPVSHWLAGWLVERQLDQMFRVRHRTTLEDLMQHQTFADQPRLTVAITGATGLIGSALAAYLTTAGHRVVKLVRRPAVNSDELQWNPAAGTIDKERLRGVDVVVHLAGENIGGGRWTEARKALILQSRVEGTRTIANALASLADGPKVLISASATGWYGNAGDATCDESTPAGSGFLADVCQQWEAAAEPARAAGLRVVHPRLAAVVSPQGGMLAQMLLPAKLGLLGPVGSGQQWLPWIALQDVLGVLERMLHDPRCEGPINCVAPQTVRQVDFARALARQLNRPAVAPLPGFAVKALLGQMGEALLLDGAKVLPSRLLSLGHTFSQPTLDDALAAALGVPARQA